METFFIFLLCDDIRRVIFSKLTVQELVRVEVVSKQWQRDVLAGLRQITRLVMWNIYHEYGVKSPPTSLCLIPGHQYLPSDTIRKSLLPSQIEALIRKLPNLTTLYVNSNYIDTVELVVNTAFKNCPKLRHLDLPNRRTDLKETLNKLNLKKLTCFSNIARINANKLKNLKFTSLSPFTTEEMTVLLNNGLVGLSSNRNCDYPSLKRVIFEHGHNLQVLRVDHYSKDENVEIFTRTDLQRISDQCKQLKEIHVFGRPTVLKGLEGARNLDTLHLSIHDITKDYIQVLTFGHRLKTLTLCNIVCTDGTMIAELNRTCPNLLEVKCSQMSLEWGSEIEPDLGSNANLITFVAGFYGNEKQTRTFLKAFPNLRFFSGLSFGDDSRNVHEARKWFKNLKKDYPKIRFEVFRF